MVLIKMQQRKYFFVSNDCLIITKKEQLTLIKLKIPTFEKVRPQRKFSTHKVPRCEFVKESVVGKSDQIWIGKFQWKQFLRCSLLHSPVTRHCIAAFFRSKFDVYIFPILYHLCLSVEYYRVTFFVVQFDELVYYFWYMVNCNFWYLFVTITQTILVTVSR